MSLEWAAGGAPAVKLTADSLLRWEQVGEKFTQADVRSDRATESRSRLLTGWKGKILQEEGPAGETQG